MFSAKINGSYIPYVIQHATPGADQNSYAWIELDSGGRPLALRIFYNGKWRRIYNGMIGEIRMYSGDPGDTTIWTNLGHGVIGGEYDGWQICNGNNNSPDLSDKFIIGAHMNDKDGHSKYNKHWQTFVDGKTDLQTGGSKDHMIVSSELPPFSVSSTDTSGNPLGPRSSVVVKGHPYKEQAEHNDVSILVDTNYANQETNEVTIGNYGSDPDGNDPQVAMPILPPFYAYALIIFQGYT